MSDINYAMLLKENKELIERINEFVLDVKFITNDTSDDIENEFGLCYGFVSHGLNSLPVMCAEAINKNLIAIEINGFTSWEKSIAIEQTNSLIELYFDKLCQDGFSYGAFMAKQTADWSAEHYPKQYRNAYIECSLFTKEYLQSILKNHSNIRKLFSENKDSKSKKEQMPFKIGLEFAKGKVQKHYELYKKEKCSFEDITKMSGFGNENRPYFSCTLNDNNDPKNIYTNKKVMLLIEEHCIENKIEMCPDFKENLEKIKDA